MQWIARDIYRRYPDRPDRRLWVGDCSPWGGNCPLHPDGSHDKSRAIDLNYYTWAPRNQTHYPMVASDLIWMWDRSNQDRIGYPETLLPIFDAERTGELWRLIMTCFPAARITTNDALWQAVRQVVGTPDWMWRIGRDVGQVYWHHMHMHVDLGTDTC